jgi:hypothetical protein
MRRLYVAILAGIVLAALVSGCTSSNNDRTLQVLSQMYKVNDYHMFRYAGNGTFDNASFPMDIQYDIGVRYGDEIYRNLAAVHSNMTMHSITFMTLNLSEFGQSAINQSTISQPYKIPLVDIYMAIDIYADKSSNKTLGGHMMGALGDGNLMGAPGNATILDRDMNESELKDIDNRSAQYMDMSKSRAPLTYVGRDNIVYQDRTYDCTVYNFTSMNMPYTAWYSPEVPLPLKVTGINMTELGPVYVTMDLQEWG